MNEKQPSPAARIVLFVGLAGLILVLSQKLFPIAQPPVSSSTAVPAAVAIEKPETARVAQPPDSVGATGSQRPAAAVAAVNTAPVESLTVTDSLSRYVFTNRGAAATRIELLKHPDLGPSDGRAQLIRDGEALVRYHLVTPGDTVSLTNLTFSSTIDRNNTGGIDRVHYVATIPESSVRVVLEYSFVPNSYLVRVNGRVEGITGKTYLIAELPSGLRSGEADPVEDQRHYAVAFRRARGDVEGMSFGKLNPGEKRIEPSVSWVAVKSKYFIVGLLKPEGDSSGFVQAEFVGLPRTAKAVTHLAAYALEDVSSGTFAFDIYAGPQEFNRLVSLGRDFQNSNPYGGWLQPVVQPFAVLVMKALLWLKHSTKLDYGWVLVIFGVIVRLLLWPLNQRAMRTSMRMQRIQPELTEVQTKYKANPQKLQEEIMRVYKDHGMTPFSPLAGCLPMLIPMPVFFALFFVFQNTIEFRGVPFLWLPDISLKDPLYIVPVFMGVSMFVMSWMGSRSAPQNPQAKMMLYMLPIMMTVLFLNFASGLNLYYAVQNVAALPQQWLIARERKQGDPAKGGGGGGGAPAAKKKEKG